jgi:hypothetical protein
MNAKDKELFAFNNFFHSYKRCPYILQVPSSPPSSSSNMDAESARLPPIAPQAITPSPTRQQQFNSNNNLTPAADLPAGGKANKKKSRSSGGVASSADAMEPIPSSYSSGEGNNSRGSPDLLGSSPIPSTSTGDAIAQEMAGLNIHQPQHQQQQSSSFGASPTGGMMTAVAPEKGITPDMKILTIMALLDPSSNISSAAGTPNKPAVILNRGSSTQNPFGPTTLNGTDGVVFEATRNGHVVTVILY